MTPAATTLPPAHRNFVVQLGRAAADLTRARDTAVAALDSSDTSSLHTAFGYAHDATGRLHDLVATAPEFTAGDPVAVTQRAIRKAASGILELDRAFEDKPVAMQAVRDAWNGAVHDLGTAQSLVKYPPTNAVYDGS